MKPKTNGSWEYRCAALYQVIATMANIFEIFENSKDVSDALDVACGRGYVNRLLPWPKEDLRKIKKDKKFTVKRGKRII